MSERQKRIVYAILKTDKFTEAHHGSCQGADYEFHNFCLEFKIPIVIHPPINEKFIASINEGKKLPPKDYIERNHNIVNSVDLMIATPDNKIEKLRSGTWATIRYSRNKNKRISIIYPI
jgi:hypothetical protein